MLRARRERVFGVQCFGDSRVAGANDVEREDAPDDVSLQFVDAPLDVAVDLHVVVAEHLAAGDVTGLRLMPGLRVIQLRNLAAILGVKSLHGRSRRRCR